MRSGISGLDGPHRPWGMVDGDLPEGQHDICPKARQGSCQSQVGPFAPTLGTPAVANAAASGTKIVISALGCDEPATRVVAAARGAIGFDLHVLVDRDRLRQGDGASRRQLDAANGAGLEGADPRPRPRMPRVQAIIRQLPDGASAAAQQDLRREGRCLSFRMAWQVQRTENGAWYGRPKATPPAMVPAGLR